MELNCFRNLLHNFSQNDPKVANDAQMELQGLINNNPRVLLSYLVENIEDQSDTNTIPISFILLGRAADCLGVMLLDEPDLDFFQRIQNLLIRYLNDKNQSNYILGLVSEDVIKFIRIFCCKKNEGIDYWEGIYYVLLDILNSNNDILICESLKIINNCLCYLEIGKDDLNNIFMNFIVDNQKFENAFVSTVKLLFNVYRMTKDNQEITLQLKNFIVSVMEKIPSLSQSCCENLLYEFTMIDELSLTLFDNILINVIELMKNIIFNENSTFRMKSSSLYFLKSIFCSSYCFNLTENAIDFCKKLTDLLEVSDYSINPDDDLFNDKSLFSIITDFLSDVSLKYGGNLDFANEFGCLLLSQLKETPKKSLYAALGSTIQSMSDIIQYGDSFSDYEEVFMLGFRSNDIYVRHAALCSFQNLVESLYDRTKNNYTNDIIGTLLNNLSNETDINMILKTFSTLETYCNRFSDVLIKYVNELTEFLYHILMEESPSVFQEYAIKIYSICAEAIGVNFSNYLKQIYPFVEKVYMDLGNNYDRSLFFECIHALPSFYHCIPQEKFESHTIMIFELIYQIPISDFIQNELKIVIELIKQYVNKFPKLVSNMTIEIVLKIAKQKIEPIQKAKETSIEELNDFDFYYDFMSKSYFCFSKTQIQEVSSALSIIYALLINNSFQQILAPYFQEILNIVNNCLYLYPNDFLIYQANKCVLLLTKFIHPTNQNNEGLLTNIFILMLRSAYHLSNEPDSIVDILNSLSEIIEIAPKSPLIVNSSLNYCFSLIQSGIILDVEKIAEMIDFDERGTNDNYQILSLTLTIYFRKLLKLYPEESANFFEKNIKSLYPMTQKENIELMYILLWREYIYFSPFSSQEEAITFANQIKFLLTNYNLYHKCMIEYIPFESFSMVLASGKLPFDMINSGLQIIESIQHSNIDISFVVPWLFCLLSKITTNEIDITYLLKLIYNYLPVQIPVYSYNDSIESFIYNIHLDNPILRTPEFISKLVVESIYYRFSKENECPYPNELEQYFMTFLKDPQLKPMIEQILQNHSKILNQFINFMKQENPIN